MAKLPELPPSPMLLQKSVPAKLRPLAFAPLALVLGFVVLALVGLLGADFEWALLAGLIAGPLGAWLAVGPPFTRRDLARAAAKVPKAPPAQRPFLFFPAALVVAALLYFLVGIAITTTALTPTCWRSSPSAPPSRPRWPSPSCCTASRGCSSCAR